MQSYKVASGLIIASGVLISTPSLYYGFVAEPNGTDRMVTVWDNASEASGARVEHFSINGDKRTDGHDHPVPVYCKNGIYVGVDGFNVIFYYYQFPLQK